MYFIIFSINDPIYVKKIQILKLKKKLNLLLTLQYIPFELLSGMKILTSKLIYDIILYEVQTSNILDITACEALTYPHSLLMQAYK